jgi:hypothetical protein
LRLGYTPIWFYIEAAIKTIFNIPNGLYWPYLLLFYIVDIATAYFLYRFLLCIKTSKTISYFGSGLFLLITHWLNGNCVLLEIPFLFWGILACWLILEWKDKTCWHYILIGFICSCSFLSKQFGLGFLVLGMYTIVFIAKRDYKTIFTYLIGYMIPIFICYLIFGHEFLDFTILKNGYGTTAAVDAGYDISLVSKLKAFISGLEFYAIYVCPIAFISVLFLYHSWEQKRLANVIFAYCGIFGFALPFYFSVAYHYMIPLVPFGIIAVTEMFSLKTNKWLNYLKNISAVLMICLVMYKTYYNRVVKLYVKRDIRTEQQLFTREIQKYLSNDDILFTIHGGLYYLYFTADILPPNLSTIGYSFGPMGLNTEKCVKQIKSADYVIRYSADYDFESYFTDSVKQMLEEYPVIAQFQDSTILLHKIH